MKFIEYFIYTQVQILVGEPQGPQSTAEAKRMKSEHPKILGPLLTP